MFERRKKYDHVLQDVNEDMGLSGRVLVRGHVQPGVSLTVRGGGALISVAGSVLDGASVVTRGGGAKIDIRGRFASHVTAYASGGGATIALKGKIDEHAMAIANGGGATITARRYVPAHAVLYSTGTVSTWSNNPEAYIRAEESFIMPASCEACSSQAQLRRDASMTPMEHFTQFGKTPNSPFQAQLLADASRSHEQRAMRKAQEAEQKPHNHRTDWDKYIKMR